MHAGPAQVAQFRRFSSLAAPLLALFCACGDREAARITDRRPASSPEPHAPSETVADDWVSRIGQPVLPKSDTPSPSEVKIEPATLADPEYANHEPVPVRRLVYRVTLLVPDGLTAQRPLIKVPAGELHMDIGDQRLRARFVGPGWPVDEGSEVRLRSDVPGVYVFDGDGGRPMGPGALGSWFHGQAGLRARTEIELRHDLGPPDEGPGNLLCALMAEWSQCSRDEMMQQCNGSIPPGFRFGPWQGELTALVPMVLPRAQLRADAVALPSPLPTANVRALLDKTELARIRPSPPAPPPTAAPRGAADDGGARPPRAGNDQLTARPAADSSAPSDSAGQPLRAADTVRAAQDTPPSPAAVSGESIRVENRSSTRVALIVQGVPIGWVKAQARGSFSGLARGPYRVAGMRPNGQLVGSPIVVQLPARLAFGPKELASTQLRDPLLSSPEAAR